MIRLLENSNTVDKEILNFVDHTGTVFAYNKNIEDDSVSPIEWGVYDSSNLSCVTASDSPIFTSLSDFLNNLSYTFDSKSFCSHSIEHAHPGNIKETDFVEEFSVNLIPDSFKYGQPLLLTIKFNTHGIYTAKFSLSPADSNMILKMHPISRNEKLLRYPDASKTDKDTNIKQDISDLIDKINKNIENIELHIAKIKQYINEL